MIGTFGFDERGVCYVQTNDQGTIEKMPRMKARWQIYLALKQFFKGGVHIEEVRELAKK